MPTIHWPTGVISVLKSELQIVQVTPIPIYDHRMDQFWRDLRDLEDDEEGRPWPRILDYDGPTEVGGVDLAAVLKLTPYYTVTYEDGQYAVNLKGMNSNVGDRVNVNQVSIRSNNSAGLTYSLEIQQQSYTENSIYYKSTGEAGTFFPRGIPTDPVNNLTNGLTILTSLGLNKVNLGDSLNLDQDVASLKFWCELGSTVFNPSGFKAAACIFERLTVGGDFNGSHITITQCWITGVSGASGVIHDSNIAGTILARPGQLLAITNSRPVTPGLGGITLDMNPGTTCEMKLNEYGGSATVVNCDMPGDLLEVTTIAGKLVIDLTTCTNGLISINGVANVEDQDGKYLSSGTYGALQVINEGISGKQINSLYLGIERKVFVDTTIITVGYIGNGSQGTPFNNVDTAKDWGEVNNVRTMAIVEGGVTTNRNYKNWVVFGVGDPTFDCNGQDLLNTEFFGVKLENDFTSRIKATKCTFLATARLNGTATDCDFAADVILKGDSNIVRGRSNIPGGGYMSFVTGAFELQVSDWIRSFGIKGMTGGTHTIHINGGQFHADAACNGGDVSLRGSYSNFPDDQGTGAFNLIDETDTKRLFDMHIRFDLNPLFENTYADDGSYITNSKFTLTNTDNGNGTFRVVFS